MGKKRGKSKSSKQTTPESVKEDQNHPLLGKVVFLKVCRLCEAKDGPFLNIFDQDKITAKKIDELMPFGITENDDLPHKICFRCSAKVEELYEFIQKCIKTQNNLRLAMGKQEPLLTKPKSRALWEEKLNKSNMSNDDICDALIKKAMEGIKDIPLNTLPSQVKEITPVTQKKEAKSSSTTIIKNDTKNIKEDDIDSDGSEPPLKKVNTSENISENKFLPTRASRSKNVNENLLDGLQEVKRKKTPSKQNDKKQTEVDSPVNKGKSVNDLSFDYDDSSINSKNVSNVKPKSITPEKKEEKSPKKAKPFDIMDHVSMIKVNGVGVLFQCKLCNRNFLKKELVMSHGCAKTGVPRVDFTKNFIPPAPPKVPVVKYINTKVDNELNKPLPEKKTESPKQELEKVNPTETKPKPKIGPASKVKRQDKNHDSVVGMTVLPMEIDPSSKSNTEVPPLAPLSNNLTTSPCVQFPTIPSLNSRYKLVPGPNNTFQLVEETSVNLEPVVENEPKKRKSDSPIVVDAKNRRQNVDKNKPKSPDVIEVDVQAPLRPVNANSQPYPVGLFQTLPHHSGMITAAVSPEPPTFTTPAMKKQSYTVVQTGNPSKLLISSKPQVVPEEPPPKRKSKKSKPEVKSDDKQPFSVTLEDAAPPKDPGFFTFINVDPLLQPSYVLPTDNIIQESQISTSTPLAKNTTDNKEKDKYTCNMCTESFSREKKLLTHIQSHYKKMDEEDQLRADKNTRKRSGRKH